MGEGARVIPAAPRHWPLRIKDSLPLGPYHAFMAGVCVCMGVVSTRETGRNHAYTRLPAPTSLMRREAQERVRRLGEIWTGPATEVTFAWAHMIGSMRARRSRERPRTGAYYNGFLVDISSRIYIYCLFLGFECLPALSVSRFVHYNPLFIF